MRPSISRALDGATMMMKEAQKATHLDGTVYNLGVAQTELLMAILQEISRLNDNLENPK